MKKAEKTSSPDKSRAADGWARSVRSPATYELVYDQIRTAIDLGRFLPGDKLPPERELAKQLDVSRTTVREAVRILQGEGVLKAKRGAAGGLSVQHSVELTSRTSNELMRQLQRLTVIHEFRLVVETKAAYFAALRRTSEQLKRFEVLVEKMEEITSSDKMRTEMTNVARFRAADSAFHTSIAEAGGNQLLQEAIRSARAEMFTPIGQVFTTVPKEANHMHRAIFDAIARGDADSAALHMASHIQTTLERGQKYFDQLKRDKSRSAGRTKK